MPAGRSCPGGVGAGARGPSHSVTCVPVAPREREGLSLPGGAGPGACSDPVQSCLSDPLGVERGTPARRPPWLHCCPSGGLPAAGRACRQQSLPVAGGQPACRPLEAGLPHGRVFPERTSVRPALTRPRLGLDPKMRATRRWTRWNVQFRAPPCWARPHLPCRPLVPPSPFPSAAGAAWAGPHFTAQPLPSLVPPRLLSSLSLPLPRPALRTDGLSLWGPRHRHRAAHARPGQDPGCGPAQAGRGGRGLPWHRAPRGEEQSQWRRWLPHTECARRPSRPRTVAKATTFTFGCFTPIGSEAEGCDGTGDGWGPAEPQPRGLHVVPSSPLPPHPGQTQPPPPGNSGGGRQGRERGSAYPSPPGPQHPHSARRCQVPVPSLRGGVSPAGAGRGLVRGRAQGPVSGRLGGGGGRGPEQPLTHPSCPLSTFIAPPPPRGLTGHPRAAAP